MNVDENNPTLGGGGSGKPPRLGRWLVAIVILIIVGFFAGGIPRWRARGALLAESHTLAVPTVRVVSPVPGTGQTALTLPAEVRAYVEAPIYARANGYVKRWVVDIGSHVKAGDLLAELDTPELNQDLQKARAELAQGNAGLELARTTAARWAELLKTSSVSEQEAAEKQADFALKQATVEAAAAAVRRLEELIGFAKITAPFEGVITERRTDVGDLITAGSTRELFRLAQTSVLRVMVRVPQTVASGIATGMVAKVTFPEMPLKVFEAKVARFSGAMSAASRTLMVELELDNAKGELLAGSYAQVTMPDVLGATQLTLPSNALIFHALGPQVGIVGVDNKVRIQPVKLGRDYGPAIEILSGVTANDRVILNPSDSLVAGIVVKVAEEPREGVKQ